MAEKGKKVLDMINDVLHTLLDYGITVYILLLIVVLPLYFEQGYGYIATDKITFFCKMSVNMGKVLIPVLLLYAITAKVAGKQLISRISALDVFVGMYGISVILSYLCSDYREDALWGSVGWYMGFVPQLILICGYFLVAKFWEPKEWVFYLMLPVASVVFVLGYLNRFGYYPIEMAYAAPSFISTIGNMNWYCSYVVPALFVGVGLFWDSRNLSDTVNKSKGKMALRVVMQVLLGMFLLSGFATLITQGSASGILALAVMMLVLFCLSTKKAERMRKFWIVALLLSAACMLTMILRRGFPEAITYYDELIDLLSTGWLPVVVTLVSCMGLVCSICACKQKKIQNEKIMRNAGILCVTLVSCTVVVYVILLTVNTMNPGVLGKFSENPIFTFSDSWGSKRGATWKIGTQCFLEQDFLHKLVGVGPDAMWSYIDTSGSDTLTQLMEKNFGTTIRLTNAHNELLTVLVNYGILGLVSFVGILVSAVWNFPKQFLGSSQDGGIVADVKEKSVATAEIPMACALGILAYAVNNIFSFQQVVNVTLLFLLLGMGRAFLRKTEGSGK